MSNVEVTNTRIVRGSCSIVQIHGDVDLEFAVPVWNKGDHALASNTTWLSLRCNFVVDLLDVVTSSSGSTSDDNGI
jgi:hypothetical protein